MRRSSRTCRQSAVESRLVGSNVVTSRAFKLIDAMPGLLHSIGSRRPGFKIAIMQSSLVGRTPEYLGADLTDRYSGHCRDVDVCKLTPDETGELRATFWCWRWDPAPKPLDVAAVAGELAEARVSMMDLSGIAPVLFPAIATYGYSKNASENSRNCESGAVILILCRASAVLRGR